MSYSIANLDQQLGVALFDRDRMEERRDQRVAPELIACDRIGGCVLLQALLVFLRLIRRAIDAALDWHQ